MDNTERLIAFEAILSALDTAGLSKDAVVAIIPKLHAYRLEAERAALERAIQTAIGQANALPADVDDGFYSGYKLAVRNVIAALRALE